MKYLAGLFTGVAVGIAGQVIWAQYLDREEKMYTRDKERRLLFNADGTPRNDLYSTGSGSGRIPPNVGMFEKPRY